MTNLERERWGKASRIIWDEGYSLGRQSRKHSFVLGVACGMVIFAFITLLTVGIA